MKLKYIGLLFVGLFFLQLLPAAAQQKLKALIVTGQDGNHWWKGSTDAIQKILENSDRFKVEVAVTPPLGQDISSFRPTFKSFDLVVVNYGGTTWPKDTQRDMEQYMEAGGALVVIHSAIVPMADWPEYNKMTALGAWDGRDERVGPYVYYKHDRLVYDYSPGSAGHHGLQHPFTVCHKKIEHPILKGLPPLWSHFKDELYTRLRGPAQHMEVLATTIDDTDARNDGREDPLMWTVNYGKGRVFVTVMGHVGNDPELRYAMECTGFQVTLLRGCEWAATGQVTQPVPKDFPSDGIQTFRKEFKAPFNAK
ncbi:ThuA domain-containing protein [Sphingobacterium sp. HMA12]|uniref:ThuA domain-containing protein n=1 Tax=Sphingobacterium sp. HMA12 TaxID=2050894 RepID=UPI000CEA2556|nr:ThuA domain-containing protein [Sphingobacterium sp. HMA12]